MSKLLTWRPNSQLRHAGLDPASSVFLDSRLRGNDNRDVSNRRSVKRMAHNFRAHHPTVIYRHLWVFQR
jgi:hypothetical protein